MTLKNTGLLFLIFFVTKSFSQVLYYENFSTLSLNTATTLASQTYKYADVPSAMYTINDGSLIADTASGNYPFYSNGQKQKAWLSYVPVNGTDTFAVSTSWLNPAAVAKAWLITPPISNISINSVLTWKALAPDVNNADGYEVYVSVGSSTLTPTTGNFSTPLVTVNAENVTWTERGLSLSSFAGQTIRIAFKNNSNDKYQLWLDDIKVENQTTAYDVEAVSHTNYKYSVINANNTLSAKFKNLGFSSITNLTINYKMANGSVISETKILSPALNYLESRDVSFSTTYFSGAPVYNSYKIWVSAINGQPDQQHSNDTLSGSITVSSSSVAKRVLVERFSSATCAMCPDAQTQMENIATTYTNVILSSLHYNDNLTIPQTNPLYMMFGIHASEPLAMIDRHPYLTNLKVANGKNNWVSLITQRQNMIVPVTVTISNVSYNSTTHQIDATVSANFVGDVKGQYSINLYVKENNVYGPIADSSDNGWNQYNGLYSIPASPYYQYGNYDSGSNEYIMSGASYKHRGVINEMIDGWKGDPSVIPSSGSTIGQTYSKNYSFTLPTATGGEFRFNADNIYLIGVVTEHNTQDYNGIAVLNSNETKLTSNSEVLVGINDYSKTEISLNVYPNPTSDFCNLNYTLKNDEFVTINVYNALGELMFIETKNVNAGNVSHQLNVRNLPPGNYSVNVSFKNNSITKKLTIIK